MHKCACKSATVPYPERRDPLAWSSADPSPSEPPLRPASGRTPPRQESPTQGHDGRQEVWGLHLKREKEQTLRVCWSSSRFWQIQLLLNKQSNFYEPVDEPKLHLLLPVGQSTLRMPLFFSLWKWTYSSLKMTMQVLLNTGSNIWLISKIQQINTTSNISHFKSLDCNCAFILEGQ